MGCSFCASTRKGLLRSLSGGEMLAQVLRMREITGEDIRHVVVMGMGEPFDNYEGLSKFLKLIHDKDGYALSMRNITVSTCGLVPMIGKFAEDFPQVNLAISLHASNDARRRKLMPIARKYSIKELLSACRKYTEITGRRITFEYTLINGENDDEKSALELVELLSGWLTHVNLIPLNSVEGTGYSTANRKNIEKFRKILTDKGIPATIRRTLGSDIDAACGQLSSRE